MEQGFPLAQEVNSAGLSCSYLSILEPFITIKMNCKRHQYYERGIELAHSINYKPLEMLLRGGKAEVMFKMGQVEQAHDILSTSIEYLIKAYQLCQHASSNFQSNFDNNSASKKPLILSKDYPSHETTLTCTTRILLSKSFVYFHSHQRDKALDTLHMAKSVVQNLELLDTSLPTTHIKEMESLLF